MTRRLRFAAAALLILAGVLTPVASSADAGGNSGDATQATAQCAQGYTYDSGSGDCEKHETRPAGKSCPATIGGHAVQVSGNDCVTTTAHTTLPTYACDSANVGNPAVRFALVGDPPHCQRTVTRQVSEQRAVTDMVHFTETYTVRVSSTVTERESYTVKVRIAPFTKRVRVAPFTKTYMGMETYTYTVRVRYCTKWDVVVGQSVCVKHGYRNEQRTGVRETLITEPVYHYENQPVYNYRDETRYRNVTRTVWRDETRTRQVCCRPVTRTVTVTRTVRDTQTAVPDATCTAAGYSLNSSSQCERPAGARLGGVTYRCATGWSATSGDPSNCERTLTADPTGWACETGKTIDRSTSPPHCHPDSDEDPDDPEDPDPDDPDPDLDEEDDTPECTTELGALGAGTVTRSGTWAAGCTSVHKSTDQVPYWAWRFTFTLDAAATLDLDATSAGDPHVYITDSDGTVVGSDDDSGADGRDSRIRGLTLQPDTYTIEVTTGSERSTGSFTLTLKLTASPGAVTISGFNAAEGTPAVGEAAVTVSAGFTVSPVTATCTATPPGAAVSPSSGAQRTVSLSVAAATEATVAVTCTSGAQSAKATAKFKANPAPVRISGLADASAPAGDADSATVSAEFDVTPADASCAATPAGATIAPATGAKRTVSLKVDKGATVTVTVTCTKNGASHRETAKLTATRFGACTSPLGAFGAAGVTVRGTISAEGNCKSRRRSPVASRTYWARRHVLELAHPGWVTITLQSAVSGSGAVDTYLLILEGDAADGSGRRLAYNDDQGRGHPTSRYDSRITDHYLPAGTYTIEATTYAQRRTGNYVLHISTDHTPQAPSHPSALSVEVGSRFSRTWQHEPDTAAVSLSVPPGLDATVSVGYLVGEHVSGRRRVKLEGTATIPGEHRLDFVYDNGGHTATKTTRITASCPTGQIALPLGCVTPATEKRFERFAYLRPTPTGRESADECTRDGEVDGPWLYTCRRPAKSRQYVAKTDSRIIGTSGASVLYGVTLVFSTGTKSAPVHLEGCQSVSSEYWQCDYRGDLLWYRTVVASTVWDYYWPALIKGVIKPALCAVELIALRFGVATVGAVSVFTALTPEAIAGAIETCRNQLKRVEPSTLEDE